jgi:hypothetical protein
MPLTPETSIVASDVPTVYAENLPSKTYKADFTKNRISGKIEGLESVKQAVHLILGAQRYSLENFSFDYGNEILNLIGKPRDYVESDLERLITEALLADERIKNVTNFSISWNNRNESCSVKFTVNTIFGDTSLEENIYV